MSVPGVRARVRLAAVLSEGEPSIRKDGRCVVCGAERPPVAVTNSDPFCSTACSRTHYGVDDVWVAAREDPD